MEVCNGLHTLSIAEINTNDIEVYGKAVGSGIGNVFPACVKMSGMNSIDKADSVQCSQAVRCNAAEGSDSKFVGPREEAVGFSQNQILEMLSLHGSEAFESKHPESGVVDMEAGKDNNLCENVNPEDKVHPRFVDATMRPKVSVVNCYDKEFVMRLLRKPSNEHSGTDLYRNISLLSIVGHGGMGKTTLLQHVYEDEMTEEFDLKIAKVFGVSTESMQCSYDCRGNSVPTILLLMQRSLHEQGSLRAEGIFRINAENSQEEYVRDQLNSGVVPAGIDVHCLAGLIKAWFRKLPSGVLDPLSPEQVMQCQTEEDCGQLVKGLPPTEASLLYWAINLMTDVVQEEHENKRNAHNVALVFAPNMTQMADPLTALMYAVQVMNFLKMLILKTLKERQSSVLEDSKTPHPDPHDENGHQRHVLQLGVQYEEKADQAFISEDPILDDPSLLPEENYSKDAVVESDDAALQELAVKGITEASTTDLDSAAEFYVSDPKPAYFNQNESYML